MSHASGAYTAVGPGKTEASSFWIPEGKRFRQSLVGLGLGLILAWGLAGCHKTVTSNASAMDQNAVDPASANLAPVTGVYVNSSPRPARALAQNVQYQPQQQGGYYGPEQQGAPIERRAPYSADPNGYDQQADNLEAEDVYQSDLTDLQADEPPPPLPYYDQPPAPNPDYLWTPGYWAWAPEGYYWVPGCWVAAPYNGALWTPGYWGFVGNRYRFHHGFWGLHIGFYGGINYGFGYTGHGYYGGYWDHDHFRYNTAVNRVDERVIRNVYVRNVVVNNVVVNNRVINRVSYNGGRGGVNERPLAGEAAVLHEQRNAPMDSQIRVQRDAAQNRQQFYRENQGRPPVVANTRPVVADRATPAVLPRIAGPAARPDVRNQDNRPGQFQSQKDRQAQPDTRGLQPDARGQVQPQPDTRGLRQVQRSPDVRQTQPQPDTRGLRQVQPSPDVRQAPQPDSRGMRQPQSSPGVRQNQPQPDTRGLRPAQPSPDVRQSQPQLDTRGLRQPQSELRRAQPQPEVRQPPPPLQPRPQEQVRPQLAPQPQPQPRSQQQTRPQSAPAPQPAPAARAQPVQRPQPQPAPAHEPQQQNEGHKNDRNPNR